MKLQQIIRGRSEVKICGDMPEECLNSLAASALPFWNIRPMSAKEIGITVYTKDLEKVSALCLDSCCDLQLLGDAGVPKKLKEIKQRWILVTGLIIVVALTFFLQRFVWSVEILGEDPATDDQILQLLQESGIGFGSVGAELDSQEIKLQMLQRLPELSWMAVNRKGGKLTVLYLLASPREEEKTGQASNLVALRDGVITNFTVLEGMRLFSAGDTVRKGQVLVSGFEDYGLCLKSVQAEGEIYGETWHSGTILSPSVYHEKLYTGRQWTQYVLIVGRKRINLCGNSGISTARCDKIIDEHIFRLPDLEFPLRIQVIHWREYTLSEKQKDSETARASLEEHWIKSTQEEMVAGTIQKTESTFLQQGKCFVLHVNSICHEMIATTAPMEGLYKGETYE